MSSGIGLSLAASVALVLTGAGLADNLRGAAAEAAGEDLAAIRGGAYEKCTKNTNNDCDPDRPCAKTKCQYQAADRDYKCTSAGNDRQAMKTWTTCVDRQDKGKTSCKAKEFYCTKRKPCDTTLGKCVEGTDLFGKKAYFCVATNDAEKDANKRDGAEVDGDDCDVTPKPPAPPTASAADRENLPPQFAQINGLGFNPFRP